MIFHSLPLITTVAMGFALALLMGFIAVRLKISALVGYLVAGIIVGPYTPGVIADVSIAHELAEIGVMLLMFGVGLHFSIDDLMRVRRIAIPGAIVQIVVATLLGGGVALMWGWNYGNALIFGISLSVASTVVLLRVLEERGVLHTINGHIAVGWLLVEDLATIIVLVLLPPLAQWLGSNQDSTTIHQPLWYVLALTLVKISTFIAVMFVFGRRLIPKLLWKASSTGSRELFTLCVVTAAISVAYLASTLFGVSFALGAFFAGMIMRESSLSHRAAEESLPLRDAFAVLFFVSVGMLFNPAVLIEQPLKVLLVVSIIIVGKSIAAFIIVILFRYPIQSALIVSASLAQIGEFSFILAQLGTHLGMLPPEGQSFILAGALISIALNPLIFKCINPVHRWIKSNPKFVEIFEKIKDPLTELPFKTQTEQLNGQVLLVGYGRVGQRIGKILTEKSIHFVVIDDNRQLIEELRTSNIPAIYGNAADPSILIQGHIKRASLLVIVIPDVLYTRRIIRWAYQLNPKIEIVARMHDEEEAALLEKEIKGKVFFAEGEVGINISKYVLKRYGKSHKQDKLEEVKT